MIDVLRGKPGLKSCWQELEAGHVIQNHMGETQLPESYSCRIKVVALMFPMSTLFPSFSFAHSSCSICSLLSSWTILTTSQEIHPSLALIILVNSLPHGQILTQVECKCTMIFISTLFFYFY